MGRAEVKLFQRAAEDVAEFLKLRLDGKRRIRVFSHLDADGISAASIMARCLYSFDVPFSIRFTQPLREDEIASLQTDAKDLFIFLDQGSGQLEHIRKSLLAKRAEVVIVDHHPGPFQEHPGLAILNPHLCGLNGAKDVSASGGAYAVAESLDSHFRPLAGLAIAGAIGDRQEFFSGFTGVNEVIAKRAMDLGLIRLGEGLRLVGRTFLRVVECIRTSTRPYMVGLSGNSVACRSLVESLGIQLSSSIFELQQEEERALVDGIFGRVGALAANEEFRRTIWGQVYTSMADDVVGLRDLREQAALFDACCSMKKPEVGFAVGVGDESSLDEARALLSSRQEEMLRTLAWFTKKLASFKSMGAFKYLYCGSEVNPTMVGEALSLLIESGLITMEKPVLGLTDVKTGEIKISARSTPRLAMEGINIGRALAKGAAEVGGFGGGHDVAAGGRIPKERMDELLIKLDHILMEREE